MLTEFDSVEVHQVDKIYVQVLNLSRISNSKLIWYLYKRSDAENTCSELDNELTKGDNSYSLPTSMPTTFQELGFSQTRQNWQ